MALTGRFSFTTMLNVNAAWHALERQRQIEREAIRREVDRARRLDRVYEALESDAWWTALRSED